jgi:hypothetical protein
MIVSPELAEVIRTSPVELLEGAYAVVNIRTPSQPITAFATMRDGLEVTAFVRIEDLPEFATFDDIKMPYKAVRLRTSKPFNAPGFIAAACRAVAEQGCNVLVLSTFSFDYLFLRESDLDIAISGLSRLGFPIQNRAVREA